MPLIGVLLYYRYITNTNQQTDQKNVRTVQLIRFWPLKPEPRKCPYPCFWDFYVQSFSKVLYSHKSWVTLYSDGGNSNISQYFWALTQRNGKTNTAWTRYPPSERKFLRYGHSTLQKRNHFLLLTASEHYKYTITLINDFQLDNDLCLLIKNLKNTFTILLATTNYW